jgi:hypothetical protein
MIDLGSEAGDFVAYGQPKRRGGTVWRRRHSGSGVEMEEWTKSIPKKQMKEHLGEDDRVEAAM